MEHDKDWAAKIAATVGQQVARYRASAYATEKRMTAQGLADRCAELGLPLDRAVIAKLEKGLRQTITVGEVFVLAKALGVPPIRLIFPIGEEETTEVRPGQTLPTWVAAKWFTGEQAQYEDVDAWNRGGALPVLMYRALDRHADERVVALKEATTARRAAEAAGTPQERDAHIGRAESEERRSRELETRIRVDREYLVRNGYAPPDLPWGLGHLDDKEE